MTPPLPISSPSFARVTYSDDDLTAYSKSPLLAGQMGYVEYVSRLLADVAMGQTADYAYHSSRVMNSI